MKNIFEYVRLIVLILLCGTVLTASGQDRDNDMTIDEKVTRFLDEHRRTWRDLNVPASDGKLLHDIIVENGYTRALEIGTSTGHSGIWIAWALSKTGGKLVTVEIDQERYNEALEHFEEAGLSEYIDARLADAHELVPKLEGPFDFVFSDADKEWYTNYFTAVDPKLIVGGCFTAHNVSTRYGGARRFLDYIRKLPNYETTVDNSSGSGVSISFKKSE